MTQTTLGGVLSLLDEPDLHLKAYALQQLDSNVNYHWHEISDSLSKIEVLYEDPSFKYRDLAALVASKVYYHLGEYDEALTFALGASTLFDATSKSEYVETIISKCIDKYIALRRLQHDDSFASPAAKNTVDIDKRLEDIVERMFKRCYGDAQFKQAIGIALESFRLDVVENCVMKIGTEAGKREELLNYIQVTGMELIEHIDFRNKVLRLLVKLYETTIPEPDYYSIFQCLVHLNDYAHSAEMLKVLVGRDQNHKLIALQIAFDLESNATQEFLTKLLTLLPETPAEPDDVVSPVAVTSSGEAMETEENEPLLKRFVIPTEDERYFIKIKKIVSGKITIKLYLEFLNRNNHTDMLLLKNSKNALHTLNPNSSVYHSAITFANAFMYSGTTSDEFLRQNLEWLSRANNWTKFSATAALGVIHKGQIEQGKQLLNPYLPKEGVEGSPYSEGGSLFALGLVNANHGSGVLPFLSKSLKDATDEVVQAGGCLGVGVAGMSTDDEELYENLKNILFSDSAVAGESAGLAMGLVMLGTNSPKAIEEMMQYAHETQHEKIIRGLAVGIALIAYGREEEADILIEQMCIDKDPIIRYGGIHALAMAYSGTGNNKAIRKLLHVAVSDVNDDVRRASVTAIGFVLSRNYKQVPRVVQLLSESYNPYVRYGATLALGISCAGTGLAEALDLLEPLVKDSVDFVKQGALIAYAMILIQHNEAMSPRVAKVRKLYETTITAKHEDPVSKFGAVLGQGIIDAGGRNVTLSLVSSQGFNNMPAIVGAVLFTQFWYWYPLTHFLCLAFTPTAMIGLNSNLDIPKFSFVSNAKPSLFDYPPATKPPTTEVIEKVATAVLSTTAKVKARQRKNDKEKGKDVPVDMEIDEKKEEAVEVKKEEEKIIEEPFQILSNLSRVLPAQIQHVKFTSANASFTKPIRYTPIKKDTNSLGGIVILKDLKPGEVEDLIELTKEVPVTPVVPIVPPSEAPVAEVAPPAPFEYNED